MGTRPFLLLPLLGLGTQLGGSYPAVATLRRLIWLIQYGGLLLWFAVILLTHTLLSLLSIPSLLSLPSPPSSPSPSSPSSPSSPTLLHPRCHTPPLPLAIPLHPLPTLQPSLTIPSCAHTSPHVSCAVLPHTANIHISSQTPLAPQSPTPDTLLSLTPSLPHTLTPSHPSPSYPRIGENRGPETRLNSAIPTQGKQLRCKVTIATMTSPQFTLRHP